MSAILSALVLLALLAPNVARADEYVYVSYSPDVRYSQNGRDARVVLLPTEQLYSYGHDMGGLRTCSEGQSDCLVFDFMAVARLPADATSGSTFKRGEFSFEVMDSVDFEVLGTQVSAQRVVAKKSGLLANSYYFCVERGVIAIGVPNFGNPHVQELLFFVTSEQGIFHAGEQDEKAEAPGPA